jgi:hypothetical protein
VHYDVTGLMGVPLPSSDVRLQPSTGLDLLVFFRPLTAGPHPGSISLSALEVAGVTLEIAVQGEGTS